MLFPGFLGGCVNFRQCVIDDLNAKGAKGMRAEKLQRFSLKLPLPHALTFARLLTYVNARIEAWAELYTSAINKNKIRRYEIFRSNSISGHAAMVKANA